jgi:hypothetical protein
MYPSCAAYAERAIDEGGLVGMLLFLDRLFYREFGDLSTRYFVAPGRLSRSPRFYDPLEDALPPPEREQNDGRPSFLREDFSRQVPR